MLIVWIHLIREVGNISELALYLTLDCSYELHLWIEKILLFQIYNENWCHLSIIVNKEENRVGDGFEQKPLIQWVLYLFNGIHFFNFGINDLKCISFLLYTDSMGIILI